MCMHTMPTCVCVYTRVQLLTPWDLAKVLWEFLQLLCEPETTDCER